MKRPNTCLGSTLSAHLQAHPPLKSSAPPPPPPVKNRARTYRQIDDFC